MVEVSGEGASIYVIFRLLLTAHNYIAHALIGQSSTHDGQKKVSKMRRKDVLGK